MVKRVAKMSKRAIDLIPNIIGYVALELPDRYFDDMVNSLKWLTS